MIAAEAPSAGLVRAMALQYAKVTDLAHIQLTVHNRAINSLTNAHSIVKMRCPAPRRVIAQSH
jgi:hypothetical protein